MNSHVMPFSMNFSYKQTSLVKIAASFFAIQAHICFALCTKCLWKKTNKSPFLVSDDNSSVQSSPWQRDHSWKQASPRRNQSRNLAFAFHRPKRDRRWRRCAVQRGHARCPYRAIASEETDAQKGGNAQCNIRVKPEPRPGLLAVVQALTDRSSSASVAMTRAEMVVSPRKRFLREMERDKLQVCDLILFIYS